jgi:hypothetical protein
MKKYLYGWKPRRILTKSRGVIRESCSSIGSLYSLLYLNTSPTFAVRGLFREVIQVTITIKLLKMMEQRETLGATAGPHSRTSQVVPLDAVYSI